MKKAFVTGASGFIGQALIKKLIMEGWSVVGLAKDKRKTKNLDIKGVRWIYGDIRDIKWHRFVKGCKVFVHLAGIHGYIKIPFAERLSVELKGTENAIKACKNAKVRHFVYVSTAYTHISTDYSKAKNIAKNFVKKEIERGFEATIVCPVVVYGPGNDTNFSRLYEVIKRNRFFFIGEGKNRWNLIYIDDLMNALILIIRNRKLSLGKIFIVSDKPVSVRKLVGIISKEMGVETSNLHLPLTPMMIIGFVFGIFSKLGISVPFTKDTIYNLASSQSYQTSNLLYKLGFKQQIDIGEGIAKTLNEKDSN